MKGDALRIMMTAAVLTAAIDASGSCGGDPGPLAISPGLPFHLGHPEQHAGGPVARVTSRAGKWQLGDGGAAGSTAASVRQDRRDPIQSRQGLGGAGHCRARRWRRCHRSPDGAPDEFPNPSPDAVPQPLRGGPNGSKPANHPKFTTPPPSREAGTDWSPSDCGAFFGC